MNDRFDAVLRDQSAHEILIARIAFGEMRARRDEPANARRQIVDDDNLLAAVGQGIDHMAADISRAASDENCHAKGLSVIANGFRPRAHHGCAGAGAGFWASSCFASATPSRKPSSTMGSESLVPPTASIRNEPLAVPGAIIASIMACGSTPST